MGRWGTFVERRPRARRRPRGCSWCCWPSRSSRCGSGPRTRATTRRRRPPARRTTCWPRASGPASTVRSYRGAVTDTRGPGGVAAAPVGADSDAGSGVRQPAVSRARTATRPSCSCSRRRARRTTPPRRLLHHLRHAVVPQARRHVTWRVRRRGHGDLRRLRDRARRASCRCSSGSSSCSPSCCWLLAFRSPSRPADGVGDEPARRRPPPSASSSRSSSGAGWVRPRRASARPARSRPSSP